MELKINTKSKIRFNALVRERFDQTVHAIIIIIEL